MKYPVPVIDLAEVQFKAKLTARAGLKAEDNVRKYLRSVGHPTVDSTKFENMMLDIDCHHAILPVRISIKCQNAGVHTGNLCFETQRFNMQAAFDYHETRYETDHPLYDKLDAESHPKFWQPSWYEYSAADWYIIAVGDTLYRIRCTKLKEYIRQVGWSDYKEHLTKHLKLQHYGRKYTDYKIGLLSIQELLHNNVMHVVRHSWA
jgi:hypothetical protein